MKNLDDKRRFAINPTSVRALTRGIPRGNLGTREFRADCVITGGNYLSLLQSIAAGNARYHSGKSAPLYRSGIATREHGKWKERDERGGGRENEKG